MEKNKYQKHQNSWWKVLDKERDDNKICQIYSYKKKDPKKPKTQSELSSDMTVNNPIFEVYIHSGSEDQENEYYTGEKCEFIRTAIKKLEKYIEKLHKNCCDTSDCEYLLNCHSHIPEIRLKKTKNPVQCKKTKKISKTK